MTDVSQAQIEWAHRYDGYERLASSPEQLEELLRQGRRAFAARRRVPDWCGIDYLRGWAFYLVRADRHSGGGTLDEEWSAVLERLGAHPAARASDRPPIRRPTGDRVLPNSFSTQPKMHKDSAFLAVKQARWEEPHVAPVNQLVDRIHNDIATEWAELHGDQAPPVFVPYIDPDSGGIYAKVLFLLESPSGPAALGSGMLSADNNDGTARNVWLGYAESGMPRTFGLHWNAVPWYIGDGTKNKNVTEEQVDRAHRYLYELLELAPDIRVVLALGKPAQRSIARIANDLSSRGIEVIKSPHPSPRPAARTKGQSLVEFKKAMAHAYRLLGER